MLLIDVPVLRYPIRLALLVGMNAFDGIVRDLHGDISVQIGFVPDLFQRRADVALLKLAVASGSIEPKTLAAQVPDCGPVGACSELSVDLSCDLGIGHVCRQTFNERDHFICEARLPRNRCVAPVHLEFLHSTDQGVIGL